MRGSGPAGEAEALRYTFDDYELDTDRFELRRSGEHRRVEPQVLEVLALLLAHRDRVVAREELLARVWGTLHVSDATLNSRIKAARAAIGDDGAAQASIRTVRGRGYRFVRPARDEPAAGAPFGPPAGPGPLGGGPPPLPEALRSDETLVAREAALALLDEVWRDALGGTSRFATLRGEPGIGKTSLAGALAARVHAAGAVVLYGRCHEEPIAPYQPFVEAMPPGRTAPGGLPWELDVPPGAAAGAGLERYRAFEAVRARLEDGAARRPTLLVLDDLHWADRPSLLLLRHLARSLRRARVLVVGAYRDTDLGPGHPLPDALADLSREHPVRALVVEALDASAVGELAARWAPPSGDPPAADALRAGTGGNPFLLREVLRGLGEAGVPASGATDVVDQRLRRLGGPALEVLEVAAVVGPEPDVAEVEAAAPDPAGVVEALEAARSAGLMVETGRAERWAFTHGLVREALVERMSAARRRRAHLRIGRALAGRAGAPPERVAHHLLEALPAGDVAPAVEAARHAASRAVRELAFEDAARLSARALGALREAGGDAREECRLLLGLGDAHARSGATGPASAAFAEAADLARRVGDAGLLAEAALGAGGLSVVISDLDEDLAALLREAVAAVGEAPSAPRSRLLARLAIAVYYADRDEADRLSAEAVAVARRLDGDDAVLAGALTARRAAIWSPERAGERLEVADAIVLHAGRARDREAELHGRNWRVLDLLELGRVDDARREVERFAALADEVGLPHHRWYVPLWRATFALLAGRFGESATLRAEALALGRAAGDPNAENFAALQDLCALQDARRFDEIGLDAIPGGAERPQARLGWAGFAAVVHCERGDAEAGRRAFEIAAADGFAAVPADANWHVVVDLAEACALLGDAARARRLHRMLAPHAGLCPVMARAVWCAGSAELPLGRLAATAGDADAAVAHLRAAVSVNERIGAAPRAAVANWRLAEALAARGAPGDRDRALRALEEAGRIAARLGMGALERDLGATAERVVRPSRR